MSSLLLAGPVRTLECITEKFVVDYACGIDVARDPWRSQQGKAFYQRLKEEFAGQNRVNFWGLDNATPECMEASLTWLGQLTGTVAKSYLAASLIHERLSQMETASARVAYYSAQGRAQLNQIKNLLGQREHKLEQQLRSIDLYRQGTVHCEQIFARWRAGHYFAFSPAGRCYVALTELLWGAFGDALRLCSEDQAAQLLELVRGLSINRLAEDVNASPRTRHYYHEWLTTPSVPGLMEHKDALVWLGNSSDSDRHPVSYSVTQSWQGIALGMPRICSAMRLGSAMVDEVLSQRRLNS
ncbi:YjcZ-like family protein [Enterobacteriaceae bacterium H18W14]|uniref:diguanylate cyclase regulator RdcB family protein n=1 Tax=Dryocola boscaweniae TaxID=2925397 RepID=UPI0022F0AFA0|nr:diguanylate cyclase regulator RdcB family protein [Dryocola boscaweniae]MCT4715258.1 YjcZ-like family protein [Dryocola boscaweniae]